MASAKASRSNECCRRRGATGGFCRAAWLLALVLLGPGVAHGQQAGAPLIGFEPVGLVLELDGETLAGTEILQSREAGAVLVLSPELETPLLFQLRSALMETVDLMKVDRQADGTIHLLPGHGLESLGSFRVTPDGSGIRFQLAGRDGLLKQRPPLLGDHDAESLAAYSPEYERLASVYTPSGPIIQKLRQQAAPVRVDVFFGTWCPFCQQMIPRMIRVARELDGSAIEVDFYGLPRDMGGDPRISGLGLTGVPTAIVYVSGQEVGRITGNSWKVPELTLNSLVTRAERSATSGS